MQNHNGRRASSNALTIAQAAQSRMTGKPFNIASYALLTHMFAQQCDLDVGDFIWTGGDCHLYANHADQVATQLERTPFPYPTLHLKRRPASILDYEYDDFEILDYQHHPAIKAPVAV
jgi:thymidylate synthase